MAFEKLLILESSWSQDITDSRTTKEVYTSLQTLLSLQDEPIRIIQRPLISKTYISDIEKFVELDANQKGPNIIILSAHGSYNDVGKKGKVVHRRELQAFDKKINLSRDIRKISEKIQRTIFILDACEIGEGIASFLKASKALGVIGFTESVDWIDSSVFILALLLKFQQNGVFHLQRARKSTDFITPLPEKVLMEMKDGKYKLLAKSLGLKYKFKS